METVKVKADKVTIIVECPACKHHNEYYNIDDYENSDIQLVCNYGYFCGNILHLPYPHNYNIEQLLCFKCDEDLGEYLQCEGLRIIYYRHEYIYYNDAIPDSVETNNQNESCRFYNYQSHMI